MITKTGGQLPIIRGTYVHPDLIPHIASWASPAFAVKVSKIVNEYFIKKAIKEKDKLIKKKDDKIDKMSDKIDKLHEDNESLQARMDNLITKSDEILGEVKNIANARVVSTGNPNDRNMLVIIRNNDDPEDENVHQYHVLRVLKKSYNSEMSRQLLKHPDLELVMTIDYSPSSINLWQRVRKDLGSGRKKKIAIHKCDFDLCENYTEEKLMRDIVKIHNERLNVKKTRA